MTMQIPPDTNEPRRVGRTTLTSRALHRVAHGVVRDVAHVATRDVSVSLADDGGMLNADVTVPLALGGTTSGSLPERGTAIQRAVIDRMDLLTGRQVRAVQVRFSGVRDAPERRVL